MDALITMVFLLLGIGFVFGAPYNIAEACGAGRATLDKIETGVALFGIALVLIGPWLFWFLY